jgi:hypothetical protein
VAGVFIGDGRPAESGQKIRISLEGGYYGTWSRDGKELFFIGPGSNLYFASVAIAAHLDRCQRPKPCSAFVRELDPLARRLSRQVWMWLPTV